MKKKKKTDFPEVENVTSLDKHPAQEHVKKSVWEKLCRNSSSMLRSFSLTEGEQIWGLIFLSYFARHLLRLCRCGTVIGNDNCLTQSSSKPEGFFFIKWNPVFWLATRPGKVLKPIIMIINDLEIFLKDELV